MEADTIFSQRLAMLGAGALFRMEPVLSPPERGVEIGPCPPPSCHFSLEEAVNHQRFAR